MLYPLKFKPIFKEKIWGGQRIKSVLGMDPSPLPNCGEVWVISSYAENVSVVENGFLAGNNLNELIEIYMDDLVGEKAFELNNKEFPLLIKFIDADDWLSIQVHPDDKLAQKYQFPNGKTEMWYVMHSEKGSELISGFKRNTNSKEYLQCLEDKNLDKILNYEQTHKGDVYFIPSGRVHALGPGNLIAEIQQTSDLTYRIYDWDRVDDKGKSRDLHLTKAMEAMNFKAETHYKTEYPDKQNETVNAVKCPYFTTNILSLTQAIEKDYTELDSFVVYLCTQGKGTLKYDDGEMEVNPGDSILLPATTEKIGLYPDHSMHLLEIMLL